MEIVIELPKDIDKLCRTCMNIVDDDQRNCITSDDKHQDSELNKMLLYLTDTKVSPDECLPKFMCSECVKKLEISYMFKQQCQNTYLSFRDFMDSAETKNLQTDTTKFVCSICNQCFFTQYKLSKHEIIHHKELNLFARFKCDENEDIKNCYVKDDRKVVLALITERKGQIDDDTNKNQIKKVRVKATDYSTDNILIQQELLNEDKVKICDLCDRVFDNVMPLHLHFINHAILSESDTDPDIFDQYFLCCTCGETFNTSEDLEHHTINCCPQEKEFKCAKCIQVFDTELKLLKHEKEFVHTDGYLWNEYVTKCTEKKLYTCPICTEKFTTKTDLSLHSVKHIIKKITCRICKKAFSCQIAHNNHLHSHPNYKHMCNLCGRWLGSRHALKTHVMGVHSVLKNFICTICSKAFKTPSRLYIHKLTHKEDKKFICSICNYKTNYVGDFRVHNRIHTAERPYECNFVNCKRQFKTSSHLNEHIQRHLQIKKYQCNMCCMVFGHKHTLKMHVMVHTGEKPFSCTICKVKFRRKHHLKNHMKQHANVEIQTFIT